MRIVNRHVENSAFLPKKMLYLYLFFFGGFHKRYNFKMLKNFTFRFGAGASGWAGIGWW